MSESVDRRDFIAAGAMAAAATLAPAGVYAAGSDVVKIGLVGCGGRGSGAIRDCLTGDSSVRLAAMGDAFEHKVKGAYEGIKKEYGERIIAKEANCFFGLDAYKKVVDSDIDLVLFCTPPGFRPMHIEYAVEKKRHIFTEKPVGVDGPGIRRVLAAYEQAKKDGLCIVAGTQRRHQKGYIDTVKQIQDGAIGDVTAARCYWNGNGIWFNPRNKGESDAAYQMRNWYHFVWVCGDHIVEQHVHNLDVINWIMNAHPVRAHGMGGRGTVGSHRPAGDPKEVGHIFDHFAVEYEYANGVRLFSFCRHQPGTEQSVSEAVQGSKGSSQVNAYTINGKTVAADTNVSAYVQEHTDLVQMIRDGGKINELKTVAESTLTAILGRMATYSGKVVTWEQALNSKVDTFPKNLSLDAEIPVPEVAIPGKTNPKLIF
jgi:myo-inositol 2-dehydrogenase / D-chiro-inositol 1-dehydrogenase